MATHSTILAWKIPWMEEPGRLESMGLQRVSDFTFTFTEISHWWVLRRDIIRCMFFKDELTFKASIQVEWSESLWEDTLGGTCWSRTVDGHRQVAAGGIGERNLGRGFSQRVRWCAQSSDWHLEGWDSGRQSTGVFKRHLDVSGITLSEISQKKTNTVWYHLHVESKKYKKLVNITKNKIDSWM